MRSSQTVLQPRSTLYNVAMSDTNEDTQPEEQAPEQQSAQDTTPWEDKTVYTPDGSRNIRTLPEDETEQAK